MQDHDPCGSVLSDSNFTWWAKGIPSARVSLGNVASENTVCFNFMAKTDFSKFPITFSQYFGDAHKCYNLVRAKVTSKEKSIIII